MDDSVQSQFNQNSELESSPKTLPKRIFNVLTFPLATILVGTFFGALVCLLSSFDQISSLMVNLADTYEKLPSVEPHWIARRITVDRDLAKLLHTLSLIVLLPMGLLVYLIVRPKNIQGDIALGLTTGLAGSISYLAFGLGWATILASSVVPAIDDISILSDVLQIHSQSSQGDGVSQENDSETDAIQEEPSEPQSDTEEKPDPMITLFERYPDLVDAPKDELSQRVKAKIIADLITGSLDGLLIGVFLSLFLIPIAISQTIAAGYLHRRGDRLKKMLIPYVELSWAIVILFVAPWGFGRTIYYLLQNYPLGNFMDWFASALCYLAMLVALFGVIRRWRWQIRFLLYAVLLVPYWSISGTTMFIPWYGAISIPWYLATAIPVFAGIYLVLYFRRLRSDHGK